MAIKKRAKVGIIDFIHPDDEAIDLSLDEETGEPRSDIEKYKEDWDFEKTCVLKEDVEPTIFKLNFSLSYKKSQAVKNATLGGDGKNEDFGFKLGNHQYQVVRSILVDIVNPPGLDPCDQFMFKRDNQGLVNKELMEELEAAEIVDDIYSFYISNKSNHDLIKKK